MTVRVTMLPMDSTGSTCSTGRVVFTTAPRQKGTVSNQKGKKNCKRGVINISVVQPPATVTRTCSVDHTSSYCYVQCDRYTLYALHDILDYWVTGMLISMLTVNNGVSIRVVMLRNFRRANRCHVLPMW